LTVKEKGEGSDANFVGFPISDKAKGLRFR